MTEIKLVRICLSILVLGSVLLLSNCSKESAFAPYIKGELHGIVALHPRKILDQIDKNDFLSYPVFRELFDASSFKDLWLGITEEPLESGLSITRPLLIVFSTIDHVQSHYLLAEIDRIKKWEQFVTKSGLGGQRDYGRFKVIVGEPYAIAWDNNQVILCKSKIIPDLLDEILNNTTSNSEITSKFWENYDSRSICSSVFLPDITPIWNENKDRLIHCGLEIDEIRNQYVLINIFSKQNRLNFDIEFEYSGTWKPFWQGFFNQHSSKLRSSADSILPGSIISSRLNTFYIEQIIQGDCPIQLIEKYWTIPSHSIIKKIASCLDESYGIYIPEHERYLENHLVFFKILYPEHIQNVLEEELQLEISENDIRTHLENLKESEKITYYAIRDSLLILSRNALNILKAEEEITIIQNLLTNDLVLKTGGFSLLPAHLNHFFEIEKGPNDYYHTIKGNITENRLRFKIYSSTAQKNILSATLNFINHLYMHNRPFYELLDPVKEEVEL